MSDSDTYNIRFNTCMQLQREAELLVQSAIEQATPHYLYRPKLFVDGDHWCALYGDNLQDGVAGFGESPEKAMENFDKQWKSVIRSTTSKEKWEEPK